MFTFRLLFNVVSFESNVLDLAMIQSLDASFVGRLVQVLKIPIYSRFDLIIVAKFLSTGSFLEVREQMVVARSHNMWRTRWVRQLFVPQFMQFGHRNCRRVKKSIVLMKQNFLLDQMESFFFDFFVQSVEECRAILTFHCSSLLQIFNHEDYPEVSQKTVAMTLPAEETT